MNKAKSNTALAAALFAACSLAGATALAAPAEQAEEVKIPKPDTPVLMIGDSMMRILGRQMEKAFKKADVQPAVAFSSLGSGLGRPEAFDWTAKIKELLETEKPKTVFVCLGTNDRQALELENAVIRYETADVWREAYGKLIGGLMDQLLEGGVTRVIWMLLPDMKDSVAQEHAQLVNEIVGEQAQVESRKDRVTLLDLAPVLSRHPGKYSQYMMSPTGTSLSVRDPDGVHLSVDGGKLIAETVLKKYWRK